VVTKKKRSKNVENVVKFFSRKQSRHMMHVLRDLGNPFDSIVPADAIEIMRLYSHNPKVFEALATYARQHPKVTKELTLDDLTEARDLLQVKHVMES
jgi:superfamily I DNA/RNA helicase